MLFKTLMALYLLFDRRLQFLLSVAFGAPQLAVVFGVRDPITTSYQHSSPAF